MVIGFLFNLQWLANHDIGVVVPDIIRSTSWELRLESVEDYTRMHVIWIPRVGAVGSWRGRRAETY